MCMCVRARTSVEESRRTGNDYARPEKSLMEIVALSSNSPEIPQDATACKIPSPAGTGAGSTYGWIIGKRAAESLDPRDFVSQRRPPNFFPL